MAAPVRHVVLIGSPGSGKTSICQMIQSDFGNTVLKYEMGHLLKTFAQESETVTSDQQEDVTQTRQLILRLVQSGKLKTQVPVSVIETVWKHYLQELSPDTRVCLYYGGPLSVEEAQRLIIKPDLVLVLHCSDQVIIDRICNRRVDTVTGKTYHLVNDRELLERMNILTEKNRLRCRLGDDEVLFRQRLSRFKKRSEPIIQFYRELFAADDTQSQGSIVMIDASQPVAQVYEQVKKHIQHLLQ